MYNHAGVLFSYDSRWEVTEEPESTNTMESMRSNLSGSKDKQDQWHLYCFFPVSSGTRQPQPRRFWEMAGIQSLGISNAPIERITGNIGGVAQPGLRFHITKRRKDDSMFSAEGDFSMLQNSKGKVMCKIRAGQYGWPPDRQMDIPFT